MKVSSLRHWSGFVTAEICKEAIAGWAKSLQFGCITEIEGIVDGRLDALLFPLGMYCPLWRQLTGSRHWTERCQLAGVEIKVSRADLRNGLTEQFARYDRSLAGLYLAGPADIVRPPEIPTRFGILQVKHSFHEEPKVICRRHPEWHDGAVTIQQLWTILWKAQAKMQEEISAIRSEKNDFVQKFRDKAGHVLAHAIKKAINGQR